MRRGSWINRTVPLPPNLTTRKSTGLRGKGALQANLFQAAGWPAVRGVDSVSASARSVGRVVETDDRFRAGRHMDLRLREYRNLRSVIYALLREVSSQRALFAHRWGVPPGLRSTARSTFFAPCLRRAAMPGGQFCPQPPLRRLFSSAASRPAGRVPAKSRLQPELAARQDSLPRRLQ